VYLPLLARTLHLNLPHAPEEHRPQLLLHYLKHQIMTRGNDYLIDNETIRKIGLRPTDKPVNAQIAPDARVFEYPGLDNVFVMESDLYGNKMPDGSCFLAFNGRNGLIGKHLKIDTLRDGSPEKIRSLIESNTEG
jgi:hypothetical protein